MSTAADQTTISYPTPPELIGEPAAVAQPPEVDPYTRDVMADRHRAGDSVADLADDYGLSEQQVEAAVEQAPTKRERWAEAEPTDEECRAPCRRHRWDLLGGSFTIGDENSTVERLRCRRCGLQARRVPTRTGGSLRLEVLPDGATEWTPELAPCPGDSDGRFPDDVASPRAMTDVHPLFAKTVELEHRVDQLLAELASLRSVPAPVPIPAPAAGRRPLPQTRSGRTLRFDIGLAHGYITVGEYDDGTLGELFVIVAKEGGPLRGMLDSWARLFSVALQHGVDLADLVRAFRGSSFEPSGWSDVPGIGRASSIPDLVVRWLEQQYLPAPAAEAEQPLGAQP